MNTTQQAFYQQALTAITSVQQAHNWQEKYRVVMLLGKAMPALDPTLCTDDWRVDGCESQAWLIATRAEDDTWFFHFDADARIIKGTIALLLAPLQHQPTSTILQMDLAQQYQGLGLTQGLSPSRSNGVHAVIAQIQRVVSAQHALQR